jgi:hypothetical protein
MSAFDSRPYLWYIFRIGDRDLEIWVLLVASKAVQILSQYHLYGVDGRGVLTKNCVQVSFEAIAVLGCEGDRCFDIKIMKKVGNM